MIERKKIYLDYNATTPVDKRVLDEMLPYFTEKFGNASSIAHTYGWDAEEGVEQARDRIAKLIGAKPHEIYFTSGATESLNICLQGVGQTNFETGNHIITCSTEHKAVLDTCKELENRGYEVTYLPVDTNGNIDVDDFQRAISSKTILVCIMHSNNEIGTIHPLAKISRICLKKRIPLLTDATQSIGKIPFDVNATGVDLAAFSAHKLYGPKGIGALYIRNGTRLKPLQFGGNHEKKIRPGTLNIPAIVGFGKACEICQSEMEAEAARQQKLIQLLEYELKELDDVIINGNQTNRLPHMTNISFKNIDGSRLIRSLPKLAVSQGSACTSNTVKPSHVLQAIGHSDELALSSLRIAVGRSTTQKDINIAAKEIKNGVKQLKPSIS